MGASRQQLQKVWPPRFKRLIWRRLGERSEYTKMRLHRFHVVSLFSNVSLQFTISGLDDGDTKTLEIATFLSK